MTIIENYSLHILQQVTAYDFMLLFIEIFFDVFIECQPHFVGCRYKKDFDDNPKGN